MLAERARNELTLLDYLAVLRRRASWVAGPIVALTALTTFLAVNAEPEYRATSAVLIADSAAQAALDPANTNPQMLSRRIENEINFARSDATEARVAEALGFLPTDEMVISGIDSADVLEFSARAANPDDAALYANTWAEAYVATKQLEAQASITAAVDQLEDRLTALQDERVEIRIPLDELRDQLQATSNADQRLAIQDRIDRTVEDLEPSLRLIDAQIEQVISSVGELELSGEVARSGTARVIQVAAPPKSESGAPITRMVLLGIIGGCVVGIALALSIEALDRTIKESDDVTAATGLPVLGSIPLPGRALKNSELALVSRDHPDSGVADGYHRVSTAFQFASMGKNIRTVLITSANQSEGKTTTSANLAWALSSLGSRVALVDVDVRRPRLHSALGVPIEPGISNHLLDGTPLAAMASYLDERLALITAGIAPPNPAEFVATREFQAVLTAVANAVDLVVLDAPPILPVADSQSLARQVDAVVLTALAGKTEKAALRRAAESVERVGGVVLGVVLIGSAEATGYGNGSYGYRGGGASRPKFGRTPARVVPVVPDATVVTPGVNRTPVPDPRQSARLPAEVMDRSAQHAPLE